MEARHWHEEPGSTDSFPFPGEMARALPPHQGLVSLVTARGWWVCYAFLGAMLLVTAWRDLSYLLASPYPYGIDGYYYVAQVNWLQGHGQLLREAPPLAFLVMRALALVMPPTAAVKVAGVLFIQLSALLSFALVQRMTRCYWAALLAAVIALNPFMREELVVNFLKQSLGHVGLLATLLLLLLWNQDPKRKYLVGIGVCLLCEYWTHTLTAVLAVMFVMGLFVLRRLARWLPGRGFLVFNLSAVTAVWAATWLTGLYPHFLPGRLAPLALISFSLTPQLNPGFAHAGLGSHGPIILHTLLLTVLLLASVVTCWAYGLILDHRTRKRLPMDPRLRQFCEIGAVLTPLVALAYSPFMVPASQNEMGLHLRIIVALAVPASILIPAATTFLPVHKCAKWPVIAGLAAYLFFNPAFSEGFSGPPIDDGLLHRAMEKTHDLVPEDAVIVTGLKAGNMVNALWEKPFIWNQYKRLIVKGEYYRLALIGPEALKELVVFAHERPEYPAPIMVLGPWILLKEELYISYREHLKATRPALYVRLENANDGS